MKNNKFKKGIDEIKNIKMTNSEKELIFSNILKSSPKIIKPVKSTWMDLSFIMMLKRKQLVYYIIVPLLIILSSGGVVFASEASLPDSVLYPIKIKIIEPVAEAFKFGANEKAKYESKLSLRRISEAEALASNNKLNDSNKKKLGDLLLNHMDALDKAINKTNDSREASKIIDNFTDEINVRAKILDNNKEVDQNSKIEEKDKIKVEDNKNTEEDKIKLEENKNKENDNQQTIKEYNTQDLEISDVIRLNTEKIKENQKKKGLENIDEDNNQSDN